MLRYIIKRNTSALAEILFSFQLLSCETDFSRLTLIFNTDQIITSLWNTIKSNDLNWL